MSTIGVIPKPNGRPQAWSSRDMEPQKRNPLERLVHGFLGIPLRYRLVAGLAVSAAILAPGCLTRSPEESISDLRSRIGAAAEACGTGTVSMALTEGGIPSTVGAEIDEDGASSLFVNGAPVVAIGSDGSVTITNPSTFESSNLNAEETPDAETAATLASAGALAKELTVVCS